MGMTGRLRALRILASVMAIAAVGFGLFTAVFGLVNPDQEPHAFHNAVVASLLIVLSAPPVIAVARHPEAPTRPLVMLAAIGIAALATMAMSLTLDPFTMPFVVLVGVLWVLAPSHAEAFPVGRPSVVLLGLTLIVAVILVPYAVGQAELQRTDHASEHAAFFHWVEMSFYAVAIPMLGLVAGLRPTAYPLAAWCAGIALVVLGIASLLLGEYASALPSLQAIGVLAVGVAILVAAGVWSRTTRPLA